MTDGNFNPSWTTPNAAIDYDELLSGWESLTVPSGDSIWASHLDGYSTWSAQGAAAGGAGSAYCTGEYPPANPTDWPGLAQTRAGFSGDFDSGALNMGQDPFLFPSATVNTSTAASTASDSDTTFAHDTEHASAAANRALLNLSSARPPSGANSFSGGPQHPSDGMETVCMNSGRSCLASSLETLQGLHVPPTGCLYSINETGTLADKRQPRNTDSVLATNSSAVRQLSGLLQCSCISSSPVQLVLMVICGKLIVWYRAVLRGSDPDHGEGEGACTGANADVLNHSNLDTATATGMASERVLHQQIAVGNYLFAPGLEGKIRRQVVASEVHQLEAVVGSLSDRLQNEDATVLNPVANSEKGQNSPTMNSPGLSSAVHARLSAHIHKQLQDIKAEISGEN